MIFNPNYRLAIKLLVFPNFKLGSSFLQFVTEFKDLGHLTTNDLPYDVDINSA
jgi:hypothetical protein